jgi:DNA-3-methyladenine glycosylase II
MAKNILISKIDQKSLEEGISYLSRFDPDMAGVIKDFGNPPIWARQPGFPTLIHIILEQQVSLASANAAFTKLEQASGEVSPQRFLKFSDSELKSIGFSRQKSRYGRELSTAILSGKLDFDGLELLDDTNARYQLIKIKGIGPWTADIYLLMALLRPDIWPTGDLTLAKSLQNLKTLPDIPTKEQQLAIAEKWKPWRAVAARIVWHYYLSQKKINYDPATRVEESLFFLLY